MPDFPTLSLLSVVEDCGAMPDLEDKEGEVSLFLHSSVPRQQSTDGLA